jgi:hypothetical protein
MGNQEGDRMNSYLESQAEFFDHAAMPPEISDLLDAWPEIDPGTARLINGGTDSTSQATIPGAGACPTRNARAY